VIDDMFTWPLASIFRRPLPILRFFENLPAQSWDRRGIAGDNPFTVRALAYIIVIAGHLDHRGRHR